MDRAYDLDVSGYEGPITGYFGGTLAVAYTGGLNDGSIAAHGIHQADKALIQAAYGSSR